MFRKKIITRFPPSPTGPFHVGSARTAIYNFLFARQNSGEFLLRIEDTDKERSRADYEKDIFDSLLWLGINYDGEVLKQSERTENYKEKIKELIKNNSAYISEEKEGPSREVVRFRNPGGKIKFSDLIRGEIEMDVEDLGDFIIAKSLEEPLYHLAVVVDDIKSAITHVIRGEDHISNTPRQILLIEALGGQIPTYAHLPLLLAKDKSKLSKRKHGEAVSLDFYRKKGYLPETMVNFLALLGWSPGDDQEIFSMDELIKEFSLKRVQKSGAMFDIKKLDWMNGTYIRKKSLPDLVKLSKPHLKDFLQIRNNDDFLGKIISLEQSRLKNLSELPEKIDFFFKSPEINPELLRWKNQTNEEIKNSLEISKKIIENFDNDFTKENLETIFLKKAVEMGDRGKLLWPLRAALSGKKASPSPFEIMEILGREESSKRIEKSMIK